MGENVDMQKSQKTKMKIIHAATKCFALRGFGYTKMSDIAIEAKVSVGAVYKYFISKEELFIACVEDAITLPPKILQGLWAEYGSLKALTLFLNGFLGMLKGTSDEALLGRYRFTISIDAFTKEYDFAFQDEKFYETTPLFTLLENVIEEIYRNQAIVANAKVGANVLTYLFIGLAQSTNEATPIEMIPTTRELFTLLQIEEMEETA